MFLVPFAFRKTRLSYCLGALPVLGLAGVLLTARAAVADPPSSPKPSEAPVPAYHADWSVLKGAYDYSPRPALTITVEERADPTLHIEHWAFTDVRGQVVTGLFVRPKADGVFPAALVLHGLGSSKEGTIEFLGKSLAAKGVACLALDAPLHGERKPKDTPENRPGETTFFTVVHDGVLDYREIIDYLITQRKDVDGKRLGLIGNSMGAMMGAILTGVDDRISVAALCVGGDPILPRVPTLPAAVQPLAASACPANYIGHISPRPLFMINALQDETMSEPASKRFQEAAGEPKTIVWVKSGHVLSPDLRQKAIDWLADRLTATKTPPVTSNSPLPARAAL